MTELSTAEKIKQFNQENAPFDILDFQDGQYGLSKAWGVKGEYKDYGQEAFDAYANEAEPHKYYTRGNGYDWEKAFHKTFEDDPKLRLIDLDCEAGGFYIKCQDLDILIDFGKRFKEICDDIEKFKPIVFEALENEDVYDWNQRKMEHTIYSQLLRYPHESFEIRTPEGDFHIDKGMGKDLILGTQPTITSTDGSATIDSEDLLMMKFEVMQIDILNRHRYQYIAKPDLEQDFTMKMS